MFMTFLHSYKPLEIERIIFDDYLPKWNYRAVPEIA